MSAPDTLDFPRPPDPDAATLGPGVPAPAVPPSVPGYELGEELGRGGMGVVYRARQVALDRTVALKMILAGGHASAGDRDRFRREAEAVARLQHPHIVQVHEIGEAGGVPFLALEYLDGGSLDARLDGTPWPPTAAAALVETLARAVQHAHERGVVHRDLKPANVLLGGGVVGSWGGEVVKNRSSTTPPPHHPTTSPPHHLTTPKIADFGLAKRLDGATGLTHTGAILGTPSYMAPEQAGGDTKAVGPAADVYALGAILYELLTGRPPFKAATPLDTVLQVMQDDPVPPTRLNSKLPRDLETIALKCLQKPPARRYATAAELADDLRHWRAGEPIRARPVGAAERTWKWAKRRPAAAALGAVSLLALTVLLGGGLWYNAELQRALTDVKAQQALVRRGQYAANVILAQKAYESDNLGRVRELLDAGRPAAGQEDLRGFEWHYLDRLCRADVLTAQGFDFAWSPDGRTLAVRSYRPAREPDRLAVELIDVATGQARLLYEQPLPAGSAAGGGEMAFSPDGTRLAVVLNGPNEAVAEVRHARTGDLLRRLPGSSGLHQPTFSPDGRALALIDRWLAVGVTDLDTGALRFRTDVPGGVTALAFSPDGRRIAAGARQSPSRLLDAATGKVERDLPQEARPEALAFTADGSRVLAATEEGALVVWGAADGRVMQDGRFTTDAMTYAALRPDGQAVAWTTGYTVVCRPIDADAATSPGHLEEVRWRGHTDLSGVIAFSPDGSLMASAGGDHVKVWRTAAAARGVARGMVATVHSGRGWSDGVVFSPDGRLVAAPNDAGHLCVCDARTGELVRRYRAGDEFLRHVAFSPDGTALVTLPDSPTCRLHVWDFADPAATAPADTVTLPDRKARALAMRPDGREAAVLCIRTAGNQSFAEVHFLGLPRPSQQRSEGVITLGYADAFCLAYSPDGRQLAIATGEGVHLWDLPARGGRAGPWAQSGMTGTKYAVRFAPDGRTLAVGGVGTVWVLDAADGAIRHTLRGHRQVMDLGYGPDSRRLFTLGEEIKVWDAELGQELLSLRPDDPADPAALHLRSPHGLAVSPAADKLAVVGMKGDLRVWDVGALTADELDRREAVALVNRWHAQTWLKEDVLARLRGAGHGLPEAVRRPALEFAARLEDDPAQLGHTAWLSVSGGQGDEITLALRQAETARRLAPDWPEHAAAEGALRFRLGQFDAARALLEEARRGQGEEDASPLTLGFLAMAYHRLKQPEPAKAALAEARQRAERPEWRTEALPQVVVDEAKRLIEDGKD